MVTFGERELPKYLATPFLHDMYIVRSLEMSLYALQRIKVRLHRHLEIL